MKEVGEKQLLARTGFFFLKNQSRDGIVRAAERLFLLLFVLVDKLKEKEMEERIEKPFLE